MVVQHVRWRRLPGAFSLSTLIAALNILNILVYIHIVISISISVTGVSGLEGYKTPLSSYYGVVGSACSDYDVDHPNHAKCTTSQVH